MEFGYGRVSTAAQAKDGHSLGVQRDKLLGVGIPEGQLYFDVISGKKADRPGLNDVLGHLRKGDVLIAASLDRLGRSLLWTLAPC